MHEHALSRGHSSVKFAAAIFLWTVAGCSSTGDLDPAGRPRPRVSWTPPAEVVTWLASLPDPGATPPTASLPEALALTASEVERLFPGTWQEAPAPGQPRADGTRVVVERGRLRIEDRGSAREQSWQVREAGGRDILLTVDDGVTRLSFLGPDFLAVTPAGSDRTITFARVIPPGP